MRIAHAIKMRASNMGGMSILVRSLIEQTSADNEMFLISSDTEEDLKSVNLTDKIQDCFSITTDLPLEHWNEALITWLKENQIDICHFHFGATFDWSVNKWGNCPPTYVAASGIPVVITNHAGSSFWKGHMNWNRLKNRSKMWVGKIMLLNHVECEVAVSKQNFRIAKRDYFPLSSKILQYYHSRIDIKATSIDNQKTNVILSAARINFSKGQHQLVAAFAQVSHQFPNWKLKIAGPVREDGCMQIIEKIIDEHKLKDRVQFLGPVKDPTSCYEEAKIYVQSSDLEGLSLSLQEAMFHGCACIATDCGGTSELIENDSIGLLYDYGDIDALVSHLRQLMSNDETIDSMSKNSRQHISRLRMNAQHMSDIYRILYQKILAQRCNLPLRIQS